MSCLINHSLDGSIPADLCRVCHPELTATDEQWAAARAQVKDARADDAQAALREQQKKSKSERHKEYALLRKQRLANQAAAKMSAPVNLKGLRWDGQRGKWVPEKRLTQENEDMRLKITPYDKNGLPVHRAITSVKETATQAELDERIAHAVKRGGSKVLRVEVTKNGEIVQSVIPGLGEAFAKAKRATVTTSAEAPAEASTEEEAVMATKVMGKRKKKVGIIDTIKEVISRAAGATADEIVAILVKKFPDHKASGMRTTVKIQASRNATSKENDEKRGLVYYKRR